MKVLKENVFIINLYFNSKINALNLAKPTSVIITGMSTKKIPECNEL